MTETQEKRNISPNQRKYDYMLQQNEGHMDFIALTFEDLKITYKELHENINKYAKFLAALGIKRGDKIGICMMNTPESVYILYALDLIGAVVVGLSPFDNSVKIKEDIELVKPKMVITMDFCYENIKPAEKELGFRTILYSPLMSSKNIKMKFGYRIFQILKGNFKLDRNANLKYLLKHTEPKEFEKAEFIPGETTDIIFTGGSTGTHKGVELAGEGVNYTVEGMRYMYDDDFFEGKTYLGNVPFGHMAYGRTILHVALTNNMTYALTLKAMPDDFYDEIVRTGAHCAVGGPPHWADLVEMKDGKYVTKEKVKPGSLSKLCLATSGGEAMKPELAEGVGNTFDENDCGIPLGDGLGATEAWSVITLNSGKVYVRGTIGKKISTLKIKLIDPETGLEVKKGEKGILTISGPQVMKRYYGNPEETAKVMSTDENGEVWCNIGDYLIENEDETYQYVGRKKRNFVCGVENIYPEQIEKLLSEIPEISEIVVTPIPDFEQQYIPSYHISLANDAVDVEALEKKIRKLILAKLSPAWLPQKIEYFNTPLERMGNSKINIQFYQERDKQNLQVKKLALR